jgi:hypothetical protein
VTQLGVALDDQIEVLKRDHTVWLMPSSWQTGTISDSITHNSRECYPTTGEGVTVALAVLGALGITYAVPNRQAGEDAR